MTRPSARFIGALALAFGLAACDASDPALDTADLDAVATVASALALDSNGALDEAAHAVVGVGYAGLRGPGHGGHGFSARSGACDAESSYDADAGVTTTTVTCERERGERSGTFERTVTTAYRDADGAPVERAADAASLTFRVLDGSSEVTGPRRSRAVTDVSAEYAVTGLDGETATVDGSSSRSGSYSVTRRDGSTRSAEYTVTLALADVTGPTTRRAARALFRGRFAQAASGTAEGVYRATVTTTDADGASTVERVERPFSVAFPVERPGRARIAIGGREHRADTASGSLDA